MVGMCYFVFNIYDVGSPQAVQAAQNLIWQKCDMTPGVGMYNYYYKLRYHVIITNCVMLM